MPLIRREPCAEIVKRLGTVSDAKLAAECGVSQTMVFGWRKSRGIPPFQKHHKLDDADDEPSEEELDRIIAEQRALIHTLDWWADESINGEV